MVMDPGGRILVSDAEREAVISRLHAATVEGRLTLPEFDERAALVYASRTRGDLARVVDDLPPAEPVPAAAPAAVQQPRSTSLPLVSMVLGLVSLPAISALFVPGPIGLAAIVVGILGLRSLRKGRTGSKGMAVAGIIMGSLSVLFQATILTLLFTVNA
jgi:hypothetical protein